MGMIKPEPVFHYPCSKIFLPYIQSKSNLFQFKPIALFSYHNRQQTLDVSFYLFYKLPVSTEILQFYAVDLFPRLSNPCSQPFFTGELPIPLIIFVDPFKLLCAFPVLRTQS